MMPFTPLHMGPGILIKALLQGSFSLMVFGWAQVMMDVQPLFAIVTGEGKLHGFTHTYFGATLIAVFSALSGKYLAQWGLYLLSDGRRARVDIPWPVVWVSAFIGTYSHVVLDSIMHADMQPLLPFSVSNGLLGWLSIPVLHKFCVYSGLLGAAVYFSLEQLRARREKLKYAGAAGRRDD
jgi:membrane-bound metal-dependent hydrolase YbcI (DUF457 family)